MIYCHDDYDDSAYDDDDNDDDDSDDDSVAECYHHVAYCSLFCSSLVECERDANKTTRCCENIELLRR